MYILVLSKLTPVCEHVLLVCVQDFYSHSNWVELGSAAPFSTLIKPELPLNNIVGKTKYNYPILQF